MCHSHNAHRSCGRFGHRSRESKEVLALTYTVGLAEAASSRFSLHRSKPSVNYQQYKRSSLLASWMSSLGAEAGPCDSAGPTEKEILSRRLQCPTNPLHLALAKAGEKTAADGPPKTAASLTGGQGRWVKEGMPTPPFSHKYNCVS